MTENEISLEAVNAAIKGSDVFCKFMSANDSGESGAHQVGFLISISAKAMFFTDMEMQNNHISRPNAPQSFWDL